MLTQRSRWRVNAGLEDRIPLGFADAGKRHLDFGHCLLRLPDAKGQPTM